MIEDDLIDVKRYKGRADEIGMTPPEICGRSWRHAFKNRAIAQANQFRTWLG